jgi:3-oxoadipate enol-lactonase
MKAKTNGIDTGYELHGKEGAPWLVLGHSLACSVRMWDPQIAALEASYRILAYDTRGHGASEAPQGAYTLEMLADDLKALLDALGVKSPHFCGLSMGGMIGQTFALKYSGVFKSLTLADTTSRYPAQAWPLWQERIKLAEGKGMAPLVQPTLERWFTEASASRTPSPWRRSPSSSPRRPSRATPAAATPFRKSTSPRG